METRSQKVFFQKYCFQRTAENIPVPPLWGKRGKKFFFLFFSHGANCFFLVATCQHADKNQLMRRQTLDLDIDTAHGQPSWSRARPTSIDDGLEEIKWTHGLGGKSLPAASYGILLILEK